MTRRAFLATLAAYNADAVRLPVRLIIDQSARWRPGLLNNFWSGIWPEAVRDFRNSGIDLHWTVVVGKIEKWPERHPVIYDMRPGAINFIVTDFLPVHWDGGRGLQAVTAIFRGHIVCMIALRRAHGHRIPYFSVNTCVHELLHVLLGDVREINPGTLSRQAREWRVDALATRMWLFQGSGEVRQAARRLTGPGALLR
jgi:hypothetical protein